MDQSAKIVQLRAKLEGKHVQQPSNKIPVVHALAQGMGRVVNDIKTSKDVFMDAYQAREIETLERLTKDMV